MTKLGFPATLEDMDALRERVYEERIRMLQSKLEVVIRQRDGFAENYHAVTKTPWQERREILEDCNAEIERAGSPKTVGTND